MELENIREIIQKTLETQRYGVYNTIRNERPHSALVGFATTPDLSKVIILTPKNTRKYINTQLNQHVNLFITTTTNDPKDLDQAITISILGTAEVSDKLKDEDKKNYKKYFMEKNTHMKHLADKLEDMIIITVETFELTTNYQKSVVQTTSEIKSLQVRQIPGTTVVKGLTRGKAVKVKSIKEINEKHEKMIIIVNTIDESESIPPIYINGLIVQQNTIPAKIEQYLKEKNIPTVKGIDKSLLDNYSAEDVSVNGNIGVIVFHHLK